MRSNGPLTIFELSTRDVAGGAERVAWDLHRSYRSRGHRPSMIVGYRHGQDPQVFEMPHDQAGSVRQRFFWRLHRRLQPSYSRSRMARLACRAAHGLAEPRSWLDARRGIEDFHYPGTHRLATLLDQKPDIIHGHNLHGGYFDLRALPSLSRQAPVVLSLHDAWLLAGHCAHSLDCDRWKSGCGRCPDLTLYPAVRRDATAENWRRKRDIYQRSRVYIATPCRWLMDRVKASMLEPAMIEGRVIPYGIDLTVFHPGDRLAARGALGLPKDATILLFAANSIRRNPWKDYETMRTALARLAERRDNAERIVLLALGEDGPAERIGSAEIRFVPFVDNPLRVADYYRAADLYLHAARADTFPCTILEALACGTPVVATAIGGIPEQIDSLAQPGSSSGSDAAEATGTLVPPGDSKAMAAAIETLLDAPTVRRRLAENAARIARERFDLNRFTGDYLSWFRAILQEARPPLERHPAAAPALEPVA